MAQDRKLYRLKLARLNFISPVDDPAQQTATVKLTKRKAQVSGPARVVKFNDELGLVFLWAFTTTDENGVDYFDTHGDNIVEQDIIKVAAEFMENGGLTDEMHDEEPDGRVVFAMPMTKEVAAAFDIETKQTGLMIGMKPSTEVFQKFKSGEYTGVSIDALGVRQLLKSKGGKPERVLKQAVVTSETDGHAHTIDLDDPADFHWVRDHLTTSYQTSKGATNAHSHAWVFDLETGKVTIVADSGHSHTCDAVVPPDVLTAYKALEAQERAARTATPSVVADDPSDGVPAPISDEKASGATVVVIASKDGTNGKSTRHGEIRSVKSHSEETMPTEQDKQIEALKKSNERLERIAKMTGAQKSHFDTLTGEAQEEFLAKSSKERDLELVEIEKSNEVVYTCEDGTPIRKRDGELAVRQAKRADEALKIAKAERDARELTELKKRAGDLMGNLAGTDDAHVDLLRAIEAMPEAKREGMTATIKAANDLMKTRATAPGTGGHGNPNAGNANPEAVFDAEVKKYAEANGIKDQGEALEKFLGTEPGRVAKRAYNVAKGFER